MTFKKAISDMTRVELEGMLLSIHEALWDPDIPWDKNNWSPDTIEAIASVYSHENLHPADLEEYND